MMKVFLVRSIKSTCPHLFFLQLSHKNTDDISEKSKLSGYCAFPKCEEGSLCSLSYSESWTSFYSLLTTANSWDLASSISLQRHSPKKAQELYYIFTKCDYRRRWYGVGKEVIKWKDYRWKKSLKKSRTLGIGRDKVAEGIWPFLNNSSTNLCGNQQTATWVFHFSYWSTGLISPMFLTRIISNIVYFYISPLRMGFYQSIIFPSNHSFIHQYLLK